MTILFLVAAVVCYLCAALKVQASIDWVPAGHACVVAYFLVGWLPL